MLGRLFDGVGLHGYGTCQLKAPSTLPSTPFWYAFYNFVCFSGLPAPPVDMAWDLVLCTAALCKVFLSRRI